MRCTDSDPMTDVELIVRDHGRFRVAYLPGTAAERDIDHLVKLREEAMVKIMATLGVVENRKLMLTLSPSRAAAEAHGVAGGRTDPATGNMEVLYLPDEDTYEHQRYGHELTHAIIHGLDPDHDGHLKLVDEGIAELFDQSGRDLHADFVQDMRMHGEALEKGTEIDDADARVESYPKAGSFMTLLREIDPRAQPFGAFYRAVAVVYKGGTTSTLDGRSPPPIRAMLDSALRAHYGLGLEELRTRWRARLAPYFEKPARGVSTADRAAIEALFSARDDALRRGDARAYRATMEGFYCDRGTDAVRMGAARRAVAGAPQVHSRVRELFDAGVVNYPQVVVAYDEQEGERVTPHGARVEKFPVGWRLVSQH